MNNDFNTRLSLYLNAAPNDINFDDRLLGYSYAPSRERTYWGSENWWDSFSSLMTAKHKTSISSLNDDNRNDEKEIEILLAASEITDSDLSNLSELINAYEEEYKKNLYGGNSSLASYYSKLLNNARNEYLKKADIVDKADKLVKNDKSLINLAGHNPIMEAIGEVIDNTTTGAGAGSIAGGATGSIVGGAPGGAAGGVIGAVLGAIGGFGYGIYDLFSKGRDEIDRSSYTAPESENRFENYKNAIVSRLSYKNFRAKQIEEEQEDLLWWQTEYPVSDYYRMVEQSGNGNYAYYNLPGIIGSSFSDTKDMGQLMVTSVGIEKVARKIPNTVLRNSVRALSFLEALRNGWQLSLQENHAEASDTSTKKALESIKKNKDLRDEMLSKARSTAINLYGLDADDATKLIDDELAFTMFQGGIGGLDPRKLENGYDYYKSARQLGDLGADTQFERNMVATAGGDILESVLMVTPYGAIGKKSKVLGRAIAGAAIGGATGNFLGFGVEGEVLGGITGGIVAQNRFARRLWNGTMRKVLAIEDNILPKLEHQIMFDKAMHAASAFGVTALAEAAEEGTQYLNSIDAEKIINQADDDINLRNMKNLFVNDLKKRGQVFKAVLSQIGLADSPYQNDKEFWSNWKGGLILGGLMTGATVSLQESIGVKKAYDAARYLREQVLNSAVANRLESQDAILKGAAFAKYGFDKNSDVILEAIDRAKQKNKNRENTPYSDEDFDELSRQANRIMSRVNHRTTRERLESLGYELGSDEANYAIAVDDYYQRLSYENKREENHDIAEKIRLMNDPDLMEALNRIAGEEQMSAEDFDTLNDNRFVFKQRQEDGTVVERSISNRERLLKLHLNVAEAISIASLLNDLLDIQTIQEYAKNKGLAFSSNQLDRSISLLKDKYNILKNDIELYSGEQFDSVNTTYSQLIEHLKGYLLDQNSGMKLADLYRNSALRMLNQNLYTNIIKHIGISTDVNPKLEEVRLNSRNIVKQFIQNVQKNRALQEIIDYNIESEEENVRPEGNEVETGSVDSAELELIRELDAQETEDAVSEEDEIEETPSIFSRIGDKLSSLFDKIKDRVRKANEDGSTTTEDTEEEIEEPIIIEPEETTIEEDTTELTTEGATVEDKQQSEEVTEKRTLDTEPEVTEQESNVEGLASQVLGEGVESSAIPTEQEEQQQDAPIEDNQQLQDETPLPEQPESVAIPEDQKSLVIIEDQDQGSATEDKDLQLETVSKLTEQDSNAPTYLTDGFYITKDGRIIPSGRMYVANPVETSKKGGATLAEKYRLTAAQIRFNIHRFLKAKDDTNLKVYIGSIMKSADLFIIDSIYKAILNNDQNAVKLLILKSNPRAWESYYTNEFFRDAAIKILNNNPVQRPDYIDRDTFKNFCRQVVLYKHNMQNVYGYKFVTNVTPSVTKINGQEIVSDPDFIAVDREGNAHIINIYTIANNMYLKQQRTAEQYVLSLGNTKAIFSQHQERSVIADILVKGILDSRKIQISSTCLLPVVVDGYTNIHRLYIGKKIPLIPNDDSITKYANQEDQLLELKELIVRANEKVKSEINRVNDAITAILEYRQQHKTSGYRLRKFDNVVVEKEPSSIAEAYAQLDKALETIQNAKKYYDEHISKELHQIEVASAEESKADKKGEIAKRIEEINALPDESKTAGIEIDVVNGSDIIDKKDLITNGVFKATLQHNAEGVAYIRYQVDYKGKTYNIVLHKNKNRKYGRKNHTDNELSTHPLYTEKWKKILKLLEENPEITVTFDVNRTFTVYDEKPSGSKPTGLNDSESIISSKDIDNLGNKQDDGKIVDIGFYDQKTGVIQTGLKEASAILGQTESEESWLNKLFLVVKQKHLENSKHQETVSTIPLTRSKFNKQLAYFIANCYRIIAMTNHQATEESQKNRTIANQLLHLFIGKRLVHNLDKQELPNVVYINGDAVRVNGKEFILFDNQQFEQFVKELLNCEIMPSWDTFNVKFKDLSKTTLSVLYDHFSDSNDDFKVKINDSDSGFVITKEQFNNDTLCQWLVKNGFLGTRYFVKNKTTLSIHNIKLQGTVEEKVEEEQKEIQQAVQQEILQKTQDTEASDDVITEEEVLGLGWEEVTDEDEEEEDEYSYASPIVSPNSDLLAIKNIKSTNDVFKTIAKKYPSLFKLIKRTLPKFSKLDIKVKLSKEDGETIIINGIERQKQGSVKQNEDGSWTIIIFRSAKNPIKTLAHEVVHIFTLGSIKNNTAFAKAAKVFYSYCIDTFTAELKQAYGFRNFKEFVAEFFTNEEFLELLKQKELAPKQIANLSNNLIPKQTSKIRTVYDSIVAFISRMWQKYILHEQPSFYEQIYGTMRELFENPTVDTITEENDEYTVKNHATNQKFTLQNLKSRAQLRAAVDGIMTAWIRHDNITPLGKNIDKVNFSAKAIRVRLERDTDFLQWFQRTFSYSDSPLIRELTRITRPTDEKLKTLDNPEGYILYEKKVKVKKQVRLKDGTVVTKTYKVPKTFITLDLPNWDAMTQIMDEFISDMRIETRKKIEERNEDAEMSGREDGTNPFGELLQESFEISPFDKASREVKWMFSTVPYGEVYMEGEDLKWRETTDHNEFGMSTFMPFKDVYGKVLYYTANCKSTKDVLNKFYRLAHTGPDKAMFKYLYDSLSNMIANRWKPVHEEGNKSNPTLRKDGLFFDANIDSAVIKIIRSLRLQQNNHVWAVVENKKDTEGESHKSINIKTTIYQKSIIQMPRNWQDQLITGLTGILKYDRDEHVYRFKKNQENVFQQIYNDLFVGKQSFLYAYSQYRQQNPQDILLKWRYFDKKDGVLFSEIDAEDVETYLHNALLECGVDVRQEVIDMWLNQIMEDNPTVSNKMDALYTMLADQFSEYRPSNFFARLSNINESEISVNEDITLQTITHAFDSGFIKRLANLQSEYNLRTQGLMAVAAHNNQYYIVSESNYINDVKDIINAKDENDAYIQMLEEDSFASGSVLLETDQNTGKRTVRKDAKLDVFTFVGMKTSNIGDQGRDYFEIELNEDIISKLELLHEGYMLSPTISDKKTYHVLKGIPLVGMLIGKRSNTDCYKVDPKTGEITILDSQILDRFIAYFKSERDAVEKAIIAYETNFYKNYPGKKIKNYSDGNGMKFSSFCCLPLANGDKIYLNKDTENPRDNLNSADKNFFSLGLFDQRRIMQKILLDRFDEDIKEIESVGLIKKNAEGFYENIGLDGIEILNMAQRRARAAFGQNAKLKDYVDNNTNEKHYGPIKTFSISSAIQEYVLDCTIKHLMSMQEYQRLFSGSKSFYKWKSKGGHVTDISVDYTKRRGGDISTGGVNVYDIDPLEGMEELGTYRCIEIEDYLTESTTLGKDALIEQFTTDELVSSAASILSGTDVSQLNVNSYGNELQELLYKNRDKAEDVIFTKYYNDYKKKHQNEEGFTEEAAENYAKDIINVLKNKARSNALQYFKKTDSKKEEDPINVADGATYITDSMCERLLREEGKWDDDMKYAFEVLRGKHGADVMTKEGKDLYKSIIDVIIGTQKYTATGFRKSDDGQGGTLMTPYYNKTALFPIFEQISYGKMGKILQAMHNNNVDVMMMTSAVKTGSQGSIKIEQFLGDQRYDGHTYIQEIRFLRKQLNTDPNEREAMNLGTQTIKIALSNLRMNDYYTSPFTGQTIKGRDLYSEIMHCYNVLADIGFEQVMQMFCKKDVNGNVIYETSVIDGSEKVAQIPQVDKKALSTFLHDEMMSRDANSNMFDAIYYDEENDRLNAPLSAISQSGWIDSILSSFIGKSIIDTRAPGSAYIQRSVFAMEGDGFKTINNGKDLKLINEDGSMDAVISIDFFKDIIPDYENKTFEESRDWLIAHKLVGENAKTYTISYRIPTQAQSSINPLKFVDVVPIIRDSIILPKDFTKLTGSDFDIDKLYLSRLYINPETVNNEDQMFTFLDNIEPGNLDLFLDTLHKAFINKLFSGYITLLMDKNSYDTKWRPIDADTVLWEDVYKDLYPSASNVVESMSQDTIAYQSVLKNNFVVGKIGIGPYALNNNNHIYTMIYDIKLKGIYLKNLGEDELDMATLNRGFDIYGNSIMSWLSGGINAHVDIAKDPFVTKLNINKYTYNISNFLIRAGFGKNGLWFLNQPVIKELASRQNGVTGEYLKKSNKSLFDAQKEVFETYLKELAEAIPDNALDKVVTNDITVQYADADGNIISVSGLLVLSNALGRDVTVRDVLFRGKDVYKLISKSEISDRDKSLARTALNGLYKRDFEKPYMDDMVQKDTSKSKIYQEAKYGSKDSDAAESSIQRYMSVVIFNQINSNQAKTTADIVNFTKIDTKKHGSTIAAQMDYLQQYDKFISKCLSDSTKIFGNISGLFGITTEGFTDVQGFGTNIQSFGKFIETSDSQIQGQFVSNGGTDITESGYTKPTYEALLSFIDNKTKKAINTLTTILRLDSIEATYGFLYIWRRIKSDFLKSSLSEDQQTKLRSVILGAVKNEWAIRAMKDHGIDPITLFKDGENTYSLAHELVRLKILTIREKKENGKRGFRIMSVAEKFKDNALLNILHDAHIEDEYSETDNVIDILDFIKIHIPFTDDNKKANQYIDAWRELYNNLITKDFAVKLMFYSLLTSNDTGGNNLFKYVPFEMLEDYGLFDHERKLIEELNDVSYLFADGGDQSIQYENSVIKPIVDRAETILCDDFDFSQPVSLEGSRDVTDKVTGETTTIYDDPLYTPFASVFNNTVNKNGVSRIPYVFIPVKIDSKGTPWNSKTIVDSYGNILNRPYIRVLNPIRNVENQQKYITYKRIGQIRLNKNTVIPIYKIINNSMYKLGQYKIYNFNDELDILSNPTLKSIENYIYSSVFSITDLNDLISDAVKKIEESNMWLSTDLGKNIRPITSYLENIDEKMRLAHLAQQYNYRVFSIRQNILSLYNDLEYIKNFYARNNNGRSQMIDDLIFVGKESVFTLEEKNIAKEMLAKCLELKALLEQAKSYNKSPNNSNDPKTFHMHSGGAYGSDTDWWRIGVSYGMPDDDKHFSHYYYGNKTPNGNTQISREDFIEGMSHVLQADNTLGRLKNTSDERKAKILPLLARNWNQVKNSDAVFAIGEIKYGKVDGGTGWAVQMAIDSGKPVHVFNLSTELWFTYNFDKKSFVVEETPKLTKNFAGIGTRSIDPNIEERTARQKTPVKYVGDEKRTAVINAINEVYSKTFGKYQEEVKSEKTPLQIAIEKAEGFIGETNGSIYLKQDDKFILKSGTLLLDTLKIITDRGHNPGKWSFGDDYDGQVSYNIGYESGTNTVMSVTNRDLYDEGWMPSTILVMREDNRIGNPLDQAFKLNIDQFGKNVTFLVSEKDKSLLEYLAVNGYKYEIYDKSSTSTLKKVSVSTTPYTSESVKNPRTAVVFTENMLAEYARRKNTPSSSTLKVNVTEGTTGTNQAVVRMSDDTTYNPNAFGLIVKKYQQDNHGRWFYDDIGNFLDTDADFTMFKEANEAMFNRLSSFDGDTIVFPSSAAMGKAALPKRFAEWLAQELYNRYGLFTVVKPNSKYEGKYGVYIYLNTGSINVYSKSKTSITNLSNFEIRPFETELAKGTPKMKMKSVEHAFLSAKAYFAWNRGDITDKQFWDFIKYINAREGNDVKSAGRAIPMSLTTINEWNRVLPDVKIEGLEKVKVSDQTLYMMMLRSFLLNLEVVAELLRTGNAEITHNFDNGSPIEPKTQKRFGALLNKVRSKLREEQNRKQKCK